MHCSTNGAKRTYSDGVNRAHRSNTRTHGNLKLGINHASGSCCSAAERSDFAVAELIVWNRVLTDAEFISATMYLQTEVLGLNAAASCSRMITVERIDNCVSSAECTGGWGMDLSFYCGSTLVQVGNHGGGSLKSVTKTLALGTCPAVVCKSGSTDSECVGTWQGTEPTQTSSESACIRAPPLDLDLIYKFHVRMVVSAGSSLKSAAKHSRGACIACRCFLSR